MSSDIDREIMAKHGLPSERQHESQCLNEPIILEADSLFPLGRQLKRRYEAKRRLILYVYMHNTYSLTKTIGSIIHSDIFSCLWLSQ